MAAIRFGAVLENVSFDEDSREVDYDAARITENSECLDVITASSRPGALHVGRACLDAACSCQDVVSSSSPTHPSTQLHPDPSLTTLAARAAYPIEYMGARVVGGRG